MLKKFSDHIAHDFSFLKSQKLLIAISGGVDSVVLTHLCSQLELKFALAHCNFNLRGQESDQDEAFVLDLAEQLECEIFIQHFDTENYAKNKKLSTQMAARELRYDWFHELAQHLDFKFILTAHHADDNLETFLINLSRGSGLDGLLGIPAKNGRVVRPLLPYTRDEIMSYANQQNLKWREDSSNASKKYLRNTLRLDVIPNLKAMTSNFLDNFSTSVAHLEEVNHLLSDYMAQIYDRLVTKHDNKLYISIDQLRSFEHPKAYLYQILKEYEFTAWNDILNLLDAQSGKYIESTHWMLLKDRDHLVLSEKPTKNDQQILVEKEDSQISTPLGLLTLKPVADLMETHPKTIFIDSTKIDFPLTVRRWKEGDRFVPFGMKGSKKVSKFLKDEKISLIDKDDIYLLCSGDTVVWIIGMRADDRFKVTDNTKHILKIELT